MLLRWDSPLKGGPNDPQQSQNATIHPWRGEAIVGRGGHSSCNYWRRKDEALEIPSQSGRFGAAPQSPSSIPFVPAGENSPQLVAQLTDSNMMHSSSVHANQSATEALGQKVHPQHDETRKLIASIPHTLLALLQTTYNEKASSSLLGKIQSKDPGLKALTTWALDTLHSSLSLLSLKTDNLFEITFATPGGRIHALNQADLTCEGATILFSSWQLVVNGEQSKPFHLQRSVRQGCSLAP